MGLHRFWQDNKVLIVMGTSLVLIHWGWYNIKSTLKAQPERNDILEPGIVSHVLNSSSSTADPKNK
uniref:Uncharacterized protein n=1 Tax=Cynoglossus semilaevis TaxID=244447 RepID=A0A3P8UHV5_CYNSE